MGILSHINFTLSPCILRAFVHALVYVLCDSVDSQEFYKYFKRATDRFIDLGIECAHPPPPPLFDSSSTTHMFHKRAFAWF